MREVSDAEITLGTGRLMGLFLGLVLVCAVFFGLGFTLGHSSVKVSAVSAAAASTTMVPSGAPKPDAGKPADCAGEPGCQRSRPDPAEMTFYRAVKEKDPEPELTAP